jgi:hypothetical protein
MPQFLAIAMLLRRAIEVDDGGVFLARHYHCMSAKSHEKRCGGDGGRRSCRKMDRKRRLEGGRLKAKTLERRKGWKGSAIYCGTRYASRR